VAAPAGHPGAAADAAAVLATAVWLLIYWGVSVRQPPAHLAARDGRIPADARALQRQWDHVISARAALPTVAAAALSEAARQHHE
jgi:hypothetical protein